MVIFTRMIFQKKKFFAFIKIIVDQNLNDGVERIMCEHRIVEYDDERGRNLNNHCRLHLRMKEK